MQTFKFLTVMLCMLGAQGATADQLTFTFDNETNETLAIELYSMDRDHVWPGGEVLLLEPSGGEGSYTASCLSNELICYGAWNNDQNRQWGAGIDNSRQCSNCCYYCTNIATDVIILQ